MGDMKDKVKGFMKKVNNPFSSSPSGKFKGQGRVLGSSSSETTNQIPSRPSQSLPARSNPSPSPSRPSNPRAPDQKKPDTDISKNQESNRKPDTGFDPFDSLITPAKRSQNGYSLNLVECPICNQPFRSEEEVSEHVDSCTNTANTVEVGVQELSISDAGETSELEERVTGFLSANPPEGSLEIVLKLLKNIVREPENAKFRKIRMSNPKIREAIGEVAGGIDLLEFVGFVLKEEGGEMWAVMEVPAPGEEGIGLINKVVALLDPNKAKEEQRVPNVASSKVVDEPVEPKKIDRQIRVFFSVPESVAARIELPDSFYNLSSQEVKREAEMRKKKLADSQLLIPKSYKEKQAKAARRRYNRAIIRFQFPDGVVLQGTFAPWELTSSLYEFVSLALKESSLEFELLHPVVVRRRVIPHSSAVPGEKPPTLEDEDLVPSSLIKFRPLETDSLVFTGLNNDLLQLIEPLQ